ncbi:MAG: hypothetical protein EA369_03265 [Bradymonadales bacterium]|nr:MAG: hypothetical protein EA369_03265 [Bradymonadales bacterium]
MIRVTCFGGEITDSLQVYLDRISKQISIEWKILKIKKQTSEQGSEPLNEEKAFLKSQEGRAWVALTVEGQKMNSMEFYQWLFQKKRHLVIGPAAGFHPKTLAAAESKLSLSPLTFTHQTAQLMLAESLYRSVCIHFNHPFAK